MASKSSDSCSNGSIAAQRDEIARQLVEAVIQCQDAPAVAGQQVEIQSEIGFIEAILDPFDELVTWWDDLKFDDLEYSGYYYRRQAALEKPLELGAAFAKETKNRALAKAVRQVQEGLAAIDRAIRYGKEYFEQRKPYLEQRYIENRNETEAEKALLEPLLEPCKQAIGESNRLLPKPKNRLRQLRAQAHARLIQAQNRTTEIDAWKKQQADLQEAAHALAAVRRIPNAPEDEDDR